MGKIQLVIEESREGSKASILILGGLFSRVQTDQVSIFGRFL